MYESMKSGKVTTAFKSTSIADGISVKTVGELTFNIAKDLICLLYTSYNYDENANPLLITDINNSLNIEPKNILVVTINGKILNIES